MREGWWGEWEIGNRELGRGNGELGVDFWVSFCILVGIGGIDLLIVAPLVEINFPPVVSLALG